MRHVTISTTGIFNAIRPSLFPPIEGKETTTFLLGLGIFILVFFAQDKWRYFEGKHGNHLGLTNCRRPRGDTTYINRVVNKLYTEILYH